MQWVVLETGFCFILDLSAFDDDTEEADLLLPLEERDIVPDTLRPQPTVHHI